MVEKQSMPALSTMLDRSENLELCRLIILQSSATQDEAYDRAYWRSVIDFVEIFDDANACFDYVKTISNEYVFLIVDIEWYDQMVARTSELCATHKIYIYNGRSDADERTLTEK